MTQDQRFALLMSLMGIVLSTLGFVLRAAYRVNNSIIRREVMTQEQIESLQRHDKANADTVNKLTDKIADNATRLTDLYAEMNERVAKIQGKLGID